MADTPFSVRQTQILMKVETTSGSFEALAAAQGGQRVHTSPEITIDFPMEERPVARSSMSVLGKLVTTKAMGIAYRVACNTPDTITATALEFKPALRGSGHTVKNLKALGLGTVYNGPFTRGETVTGSNSAATARVVKAAANGDSWIYVDAINSGLESAETLTGSSSGATVTTTSAEANHGYIALPISDNLESVCMEKQEDGYYWAIAGAMSNLNFTAEASKPCYFDFAFNGPYYAQGAKAMTTGITYQTEKPPKFQGAGFSLGGVTSLVVKSVTFDQNSEPVPRTDANTATTGIIAYYKPSRNDGPKLTVSIELPPAGTINILNQFANETTVACFFNVGTTKGKAFMFFADYLQVETISYTDSDGIRTIDLTYVCVGAANGADDEYEMIWY